MKKLIFLIIFLFSSVTISAEMPADSSITDTGGQTEINGEATTDSPGESTGSGEPSAGGNPDDGNDDTIEGGIEGDTEDSGDASDNDNIGDDNDINDSSGDNGTTDDNTDDGNIGDTDDNDSSGGSDSDGADDNVSDIPEVDFYDGLEASSKIFVSSDNIIFETIPENQYSEFYDDYTIAQRLTKNEEYIIYQLPYWHRAKITAYFYNGEEINHFMIFGSADGEDFTELAPETEVISEEGKWHKAIYTVEKSDIRQKYIKISWQDLSETQFTNWGQALGEIEVFNEAPAITEIKYLSDTVFAIPDTGETQYKLNAAVCDQMGEPFDAPLSWQEITREKIILTADGRLTLISTEEDEIPLTLTVSVPETEASLDISVILMHYPLGDVNSDFKITFEDLQAAGKLFMKSPPEGSPLQRGDINQNEKTDIYDLAYISYNMEEDE